MVLYFKLDDKNRLWLLFCTGLKVREKVNLKRKEKKYFLKKASFFFLNNFIFLLILNLKVCFSRKKFRIIRI
jgi:hypothetical protein